jgi:hypothetical protein
VQGESLLESGGEGDDAVFAALALGDPDAAGIEVDVSDPDPDELGNPDAGVEQGLDEDDVAGAAGFPDGVVERADLASVGTYGSFLGALVTSTPSSPRRCRNTSLR